MMCLKMVTSQVNKMIMMRLKMRGYVDYVFVCFVDNNINNNNNDNRSRWGCVGGEFVTSAQPSWISSVKIWGLYFITNNNKNIKDCSLLRNMARNSRIAMDFVISGDVLGDETRVIHLFTIKMIILIIMQLYQSQTEKLNSHPLGGAQISAAEIGDEPTTSVWYAIVETSRPIPQNNIVIVN